MANNLEPRLPSLAGSWAPRPFGSTSALKCRGVRTDAIRVNVHGQDTAWGPPRVGSKDLLEALPDTVVVIDTDFTLVWANGVAEEQLGWRLCDLRGLSAAELIHPDDIEFAARSLVSVQGRALGSPIEVRIRDRASRYHRFEVRGRAVDGLVVMVLRDVTQRRRWEVAGGDSQLLQAVIDSAPAATILLDLDGRIRGASRALTSLLGHDVELLVGEPLANLAIGSDVSTLSAELALAASKPGRRSFEAQFKHRCLDRAVAMSVTVSNLGDDKAIEGLLVTAVDIGPLVEARAQLEHLATRDSLTGLLNRVLFRDRLDEALANAAPMDGSVAVLFCDVDAFKAINDFYGHLAGDEVLTEIAARLRLVVRGGDTICRFGGDEFVILLRVDPAATGAAADAVDRIRSKMLEPVILRDGRAVPVTMSIGLAMNATAADADALLRAADGAMYEAKRRTRTAGAR